MAIEQIKRIKEVEEQAEQIRKKSHADVKQMTVDAEKQVALLMDKARREAEDAYKKTLTKAEADAQSVYDEIIQKAKTECSHISAGADKNLESAVSIIIGRVVR